MLLNQYPESPEVRRQHGLEEIEHLRFRVRLWKEDYLRHAPPGAGEEFLYLCREFMYEIEEYLYPYVRRLIETEHIDRDQATELMNYCYEQVLEVAEHLNLQHANPL